MDELIDSLLEHRSYRKKKVEEQKVGEADKAEQIDSESPLPDFITHTENQYLQDV